MNAYKRYLKNIAAGNGVVLHRNMTQADVFFAAFGRLARNARGWMDLSFDIKELPDLAHNDMAAAYTMAVSMLHGFYNEPLPEKTLKSRKVALINRERARYMSDDFAECEFLKGDGEEIIPLIHGGDWGRIQAALMCGRGYHTENYMTNPQTNMIESTGLMFHSEYAGRAHYYAQSAASQRVGVQAVLMAMVKRKYVFQNEDRDEYSLPTWHYDKIIKWEVVLGWEDEYYGIEEYYQKKYRNKEVVSRLQRLLEV